MSCLKQTKLFLPILACYIKLQNFNWRGWIAIFSNFDRRSCKNASRSHQNDTVKQKIHWLNCQCLDFFDLILAAITLKLLEFKTDKNGQVMNSQTNTKQTKAKPKKYTTESAGNISAIKRLFKNRKHTKGGSFHQVSPHFVSDVSLKDVRAKIF